MTSNEQLVFDFYTNFNKKDFLAMQMAYADELDFFDPVFHNLNCKKTKAMWHMLILGGTDLRLTVGKIKESGDKVTCTWIATYTFSLTKRRVVNVIDAEMIIKNGKIVKHKDNFDFYLWSRQAFGFKGLLLGWAPFFNNKINSTVSARLKKFISEHPEYQ
jgi:hypothetical protein